MERNFSTQKIILTAVFFVLIFATLSIIAYNEHNLASQYRHDLENTYRNSLEELSEYTANMEITLTKELYTNTPTQQHSLAAKLLSESNGAKSAMSHLPLVDVELEHIGKFISQVGDFATHISKKISSGQKVSREEMQNIKDLSKFAKKINENLKNVLEHFENGQNNIIEFSKDVNNNVGQEPYINSGFKEINDVFTDYPTLIYDGPFSDHISQAEPKSLKGKEVLSNDELLKNVAKFLDNVEESSLTKNGETNNTLPILKFVTDHNVEVGITKTGGIIDYMINPRHVNSSDLSCSHAIDCAKEFLHSHGYDNMKESYFSSSNNVCTINFAYTENDVIYYSDLIKIGVALDNGEIVLFESTGYTMNHVSRKFPAKLISEEKAKESVSPYLTIEKTSIACSPTKGLNEVLCYEFKCTSEENEHVLVYINAESGMEEQIFIIRESLKDNVVF